jgi:hypothetical protein
MTTIAGAKPSSKQVYLRSLEERLRQKKAQLANVKRKVKHAAKASRSGINVQVQNAEKRADSALATMTAQLQILKDADDISWEQLKFGIEIAWEDLSLSVARIVARFS